MFHSIPSLPICVDNHYISPEKAGVEKAYLVGITTQRNQPLLFTVHLQSGALYSRLPIEALYSFRFGGRLDFLFETKDLQPWSCLSDTSQVYAIDHLRYYDVRVKINKVELPAHYLMTVDYFGDGLADDPEQFKTHNLVVLPNCQIAALPNNRCLFVDQYFTTGDSWPRYQRRSKHYFVG